ncbi:MAG: orotate phosphoribosyltransferase [Armatimonadota bacterium]|nr:orotate phosphoribosyltransferase [Armatimonadota bacterium]
MTAGLPPDEVRRVLEETGVIRRGHFLLTSGLHTDLFLLCALVQQHPAPTARLAAAMAAPYRDARVQVVAGTAMGGVILAYEVARVLGARAIYAEKARDGGMVLRRGFRVAPGERALVVEDAVTTGGSIRKVLRAVEAAGGHVVGVSALVDRSAGRTDVGVPLRALLTLDVPAWEPATCPLCRQGVRLVEPKELTG